MVKSSEKFQYYAALSVNLMSVAYGISIGWISASFLILQSDESPLENGPMSNEEASWVGSIICIGGLLGNFIYIWMSEIIGTKLSILLISVPSILSWILIIFAKNVTHLCISRFLAGLIGGGVFALVPVYIIEISEDKIRGTLGSFIVLSTNLGILIAFILGNYLSYIIVPYISLSLPILFIVPILFLPETPQRLLKNEKIYEAEKSLRFFRNVNKKNKETSEIFLAEMEKLKIEYFQDNKSCEKSDTTITWNDFNNRIARKSLLIGIALMALNQFCGCFAMINYTGTIFKIAGSNLSANVSAIIVGIIQLIGTYISTLLVEKIGRKILYVLSALGTGTGLTILGLYIYLISLKYDCSDFQWVPLASFSFVIFTACLGILTLAFLVLSEIMPPKIRSFGCMICMTLLWIFAFLILKLLPVFTDLFGMHTTMFIFAFCSFIGAIFVFIFVPETKGKSIKEILALL